MIDAIDGTGNFDFLLSASQTLNIKVINMKEVEEYLAAVAEPARTTLSKIRAMIRSVVPPQATDGISYGMPAFRYKGPLVGYAAFPNHCGLYPMNPAVIVALQEDLKGYQTSKGAIRFPVGKPLPAALVKKIVKIRIAENENRKGFDSLTAAARPSTIPLGYATHRLSTYGLQPS